MPQRPRPGLDEVAARSYAFRAATRRPLPRRPPERFGVDPRWAEVGMQRGTSSWPTSAGRLGGRRR